MTKRFSHKGAPSFRCAGFRSDKRKTAGTRAAANANDGRVVQAMQVKSCEGDSGLILDLLRDFVEAGAVINDETLLATVKADGLLINSLQALLPDRVMPPFVRLAAVQQTGWAIQYLAEPTIEEMLAAVEQNGMSVRYLLRVAGIATLPEAVQLAAVRQNPLAIRYLRLASNEVRIEAVRRCGLVIAAVHAPSEDVQVAAVRQNPAALGVIYKPSARARAVARTHCSSG